MTGSAKQSILFASRTIWIASAFALRATADAVVALLLGRNRRLVRPPPQSKLSSPGLTGGSSTPRPLICLKRLWNTGSPGQPGDDSGVCFIHQGRLQGRYGT